jgi:hypothetical protein
LPEQDDAEVALFLKKRNRNIFCKGAGQVFARRPDGQITSTEMVAEKGFFAPHDIGSTLVPRYTRRPNTNWFLAGRGPLHPVESLTFEVRENESAKRHDRTLRFVPPPPFEYHEGAVNAAS